MLTTLIKFMDELHIEYTTLMSIPTSVCSHKSEPDLNPLSGRHHCGPNYYLPDLVKNKKMICEQDYALALKSVELFPDTEVDARLACKYGMLPPDEKKRFDPMITGLPLGDPRCSTRLLEKLAYMPDVFTGVGEITVHKEVVDHLLKSTWADLENNVSPLITLIGTCGEIGMPVVIHCDVSLPCEGPEEMPKFLNGIKRLFGHEKVTATTIVWAHAGGLGRYVNAPPSHVEQLSSMLNELPNLNIDISWTVVAERLTDPASSEQWISLIRTHSDRFLFGSDALAPKTKEIWNETYDKYLPLLDKLPPDFAEIVCLANYRRVFVDARKRVRDFEQTRLPAIMQKLRENWLRGPNLQSSLPTYISASASTSTSTSTTNSNSNSNSNSASASNSDSYSTSNSTQFAYS